MRWGFFARCDNGGLGAESWELAKHLDPDKILAIRGEHGHYPERFKNNRNVTYIDSIPTIYDVEQFIKDLDLVFVIETPYRWELFNIAREKGVKTILRVNYEFLLTEYIPDLYMVPSKWNWENIKESKVYLPFPVNRDIFPFVKRNKIKSFYHLAGHFLHEDRNGTEALIQALPYLKTKPSITIYTQHDLGQEVNYPNVTVIHRDFENYWEMHTGDCLILPRRYGGQSLQLNEALSKGVPVIMPSVCPQNEFLPPEMMFRQCGHREIWVQNGKVDCENIDPQVLAEKIDEMYNMDVGKLSDWSNAYADTISWETLGPQYLKIFKELTNGK